MKCAVETLVLDVDQPTKIIQENIAKCFKESEPQLVFLICNSVALGLVSFLEWDALDSRSEEIFLNEIRSLVQFSCLYSHIFPAPIFTEKIACFMSSTGKISIAPNLIEGEFGLSNIEHELFQISPDQAVQKKYDHIKKVFAPEGSINEFSRNIASITTCNLVILIDANAEMLSANLAIHWLVDSFNDPLAMAATGIGVCKSKGVSHSGHDNECSSPTVFRKSSDLRTGKKFQLPHTSIFGFRKDFFLWCVSEGMINGNLPLDCLLPQLKIAIRKFGYKCIFQTRSMVLVPDLPSEVSEPTLTRELPGDTQVADIFVPPWLNMASGRLKVNDEMLLPGVTVVIPTRGRRGSVEDLVLSLERDSSADEIIVVIDGDIDGTEEALWRGIGKHELLTVISLGAGAPFGPGFARTVGAKAAANPILLFLDDDLLLGPTDVVLQHKLAHNELESSICIGPAYVDMRVNASRAAGRNVWVSHSHRTNTETILGWKDVCTANMSVRAVVLRELGYFPKIKRREDWLLGMRAMRAGVRIRPVGGAVTYQKDEYFAFNPGLIKVAEEAKADASIAREYPGYLLSVEAGNYNKGSGKYKLCVAVAAASHKLGINLPSLVSSIDKYFAVSSRGVYVKSVLHILLYWNVLVSEYGSLRNLRERLSQLPENRVEIDIECLLQSEEASRGDWFDLYSKNELLGTFSLFSYSHNQSTRSFISALIYDLSKEKCKSP